MEKTGELKVGHSRCVVCGHVCTCVVKRAGQEVPLCKNCEKEDEDTIKEAAEQNLSK